MLIAFLTDRPRKRKKKNRPELRSYQTWAWKFPKKNSKKIQKIKTSFRKYFYLIRVNIGWEREKKNLVPNSVPTRPRLESYQKTTKKFKKLKNINLAIFLSKLGWDRPRKKKKIFVLNSIPTRLGLVNSKKK